MKLSKSEIERIAREYGLGRVKRTEVMNSGWVNFSFDVQTDKGRYVVQILGDPYNDWKQKRMKLQFAVLNHLREKGFPYQIPAPIPTESSEQQYITQFSGGRNLWVYERIEGRTVKGLNLVQFREAMKGLALFHRYTRDFQWPVSETPISFDWASEGFERIKNVDPKNNTDRFVIEHLPFLEECITRLRRINFRTRKQLIHTDFNNDNILFQGNRLVGIIDFDNVEFAPIAKDIALAGKRIKYPYWKIDSKKIPLYIKEYRKYAPLSKREEDLIIPLLIGENCSLIRWFYWDMQKHLNERQKSIKDTMEQTELLVSWMDWK